MTAPRSGILVRSLRGTWNLLNFTRRLIFNLAFLALLLVVAVVLLSPSPRLHSRTTLVIEPQGAVVEQYSIEPLERALARLQGLDVPEVRLRDLLQALDHAATDDRIERVLLRADGISALGYAALRDLSTALGRLRAAGKQVIAYADVLEQKQYLLAAQADEVYLHPDGLVWIEGLSSYRGYYREALEDKLELDVHLFRVGEYKSYGEPFVLDGPSDEALVANRFWMDDIWRRWLDDVAAARKLDPGQLEARILTSDVELAAQQGDAARMALAWGLVDGLKTEDQTYDLLGERGSRDDHGDLLEVALHDYLAFRRSPALDRRSQIAVVVAQGEILDGEQPPGRVGGHSTAALIRNAREDDQVAALVLRVDSPGGSAFASEQIRRELELTRAAGKPVVASMGNIAASGGYWIAMEADEIWADPSTLTGSIGVIGLYFTAQQTLANLGIRVAGTGTTPLAGALDPRKSLEPMLGRIVQSLVDKTYRDFVDKVALARERGAEQIDQVARGRVWTGAQALERGLVDSLGGLEDALAAAARRANLAQGEYRVRYVETEPSTFERLLESATGNVGVQRLGRVLPLDGPLAWLQMDPRLGAELRRELNWLLPPPPGARPFRSVAHCFCSP